MRIYQMCKIKKKSSFQPSLPRQNTTTSTTRPSWRLCNIAVSKSTFSKTAKTALQEFEIYSIKTTVLIKICNIANKQNYTLQIVYLAYTRFKSLLKMQSTSMQTSLFLTNCNGKKINNN